MGFRVQGLQSLGSRIQGRLHGRPCSRKDLAALASSWLLLQFLLGRIEGLGKWKPQYP